MAYVVNNVGTGTVGTVLIHTFNTSGNEGVKIVNTGNALCYIGVVPPPANHTGLPVGPGSTLELHNTFTAGASAVALYAMTGTLSGAGNIGQLTVNAIVT